MSKQAAKCILHTLAGKTVRVPKVYCLLISLTCWLFAVASHAQADDAQSLAITSIPAGLEHLSPFPKYPISASIERDLDTSLDLAVHTILDYPNQCMDCRYFVSNVLTQEIFQNSGLAHQFVVWQNVGKVFRFLGKELPIRSSSFAEVMLYRSPDANVVIIDSLSVSEQRAAQMQSRYLRDNDPAFTVLHSRWSLTRLDPGKHGGKQVRISGIAGGKPDGPAALAPKYLVRKELVTVMEDTLSFIE